MQKVTYTITKKNQKFLELIDLICKKDYLMAKLALLQISHF